MNDTPDPLLVRALRGDPTPRRPVWLMRQAGRYLPGYQAIRAKIDFLALCRRPDLSAEVSVEPYERFGVDAAIVFSDILIPLEAMGMEVRFGDRGPSLPEPVRTADEIAALEDFDPREKTPWILETISRLVEAVPADIPVIGFAGAPFTLASYAIEGTLTKSMIHAKGLRWRDPDAFRSLLTHLANATVPYLAEQARAGARVLQVFDSWAGALSREDWATFCVPSLRIIFDGVRAELGDACPPLVLYSNGTTPWIDQLPRCGADAYSVDWRLPVVGAHARMSGKPVQGNLDPTALLGTESAVREATRAMLDPLAGKDGVAVNLGHGVLPPTPHDNVAAFVEEAQRP